MKPNLFRSVSNALSESFPLLPRIRRSFFGLMLFCLVFMLVGIVGSDHISFPVKPINAGMAVDGPSSMDRTATVSAGHELSLDNPVLSERILLANNGIDLINLFFLLVISLIIVLVIPKLQQNNLFRKDISNSLRLIGYIVMTHALLSAYRDIELVPSIVEKHTNHQFTSIRFFPVETMAEAYFALVLLAFANIYKRGVKLQAEQDLTV